MAHSLRDSGSSILVADEPHRPRLEEVQAKSPGLRRIVWLGTSEPPADAIDYEELIDAADPIPDERRGGDALAGLFYTGGTTGFPKGVMLTHATLVTGALGSVAWRFVNPDRTSAVLGKSVSVRVDLGGRRTIKKTIIKCVVKRAKLTQL